MLDKKERNEQLNNDSTEYTSLLLQLLQQQIDAGAKKDQMIENLTNEMALLREQVAFLTHKIYGRSKETIPEQTNGQMSLDLFDVPETTSSDEEDEEITVPTHKRKKKGTKASKMAAFPQKEVHHECNEKERQCPNCGDQMNELGTQKVRDEIAFHQAKLETLQHIQHSYCCKTCERSGETVIKKATVPKPLISNSLGSASVVTETIRQKFEMNVPAYRQIKYWHQIGLDITRENISNWHNTVGHEYLSLLVERFRMQLSKGDIAFSDETHYRVLNSAREKTYYWVFSNLTTSTTPLVVYHHSESREGKVAQEFLKDFSGYNHCDGYSVYNSLDGIVPVRCLAHARRKFYESIPTKNKEEHVATKVIKQMKKIFHLESTWKELPSHERLEKRNQELRPLFDQLYQLIAGISAVPKSKLDSAVTYASKYRGDIERIFEDGRLELTNNQSERYVKRVVMTRKNCLFSTSLKGAQASGHILSVIETAKLNGLDTCKYLNYLFTELPNLPVLTAESLDAYLPWADQVQKICKK